MKSKIFAGIIILALSALMLGGCNKSASNATTDKNEKVEAMTKKKITLTYATFSDQKIAKALADGFMKKYPNITIKLVTVDEGGWNDGLMNMAGAGTMPDVFAYQGDVDLGIRNGWFADITKYWNADDEAKNVLSTLKDPGKFDGTHKLVAAVRAQPEVVLLNTKIFKDLNIDLPETDWTYDEMVDLMQKTTVPEKGYFGYSDNISPMNFAPVANMDGIGEFGYDGKKYDFSEWAKAMQLEADFTRSGVRAPSFGSDEAEEAFGDRDLWAPVTGKVAMITDFIWTAARALTPEFVDKGLSYAPYAIPKGTNSKTLNKAATVDFAAVSAGSKHPREAYEFLKYVGWSKEGWNQKLDLFKTLKNDDGSLSYITPNEVPINNDKALWAKFSKMFPDTKYWKDYIAQSKWPVPTGGSCLPGFSTFMDEVYWHGEYGNVETAVIEGDITAADVEQELTDQANRSLKEALAELKNY